MGESDGDLPAMVATGEVTPQDKHQKLVDMDSEEVSAMENLPEFIKKFRLDGRQLVEIATFVRKVEGGLGGSEESNPSRSGRMTSMDSKPSRGSTPNDQVVGRLRRSNAKLRKQLKEMTKMLDVRIQRQREKDKKKRSNRASKAHLGLEKDTEKDPNALAEQLAVYEKRLRISRRDIQKLKRLVERTKPETVVKMENLIHEQELKFESMLEENKTLKNERRLLKKRIDQMEAKSSDVPDELQRLSSEARVYREKCRKYAKKADENEKQAIKHREQISKLEASVKSMKSRLRLSGVNEEIRKLGEEVLNCFSAVSIWLLDAVIMF
mmetsp:Transcript_7544/g.14706  ORF Transcript_7544/g.14706 Transcript_7544/m.14706 type:complete len:324 (+) Transcript_7544:165-1136(+)